MFNIFQVKIELSLADRFGLNFMLFLFYLYNVQLQAADGYNQVILNVTIYTWVLFLSIFRESICRGILFKLYKFDLTLTWH